MSAKLSPNGKKALTSEGYKQATTNNNNRPLLQRYTVDFPQGL